MSGISSSSEDVTDTKLWRELKRQRQERRAGNRERAPETLRRHGLIFGEHNHGAHLIVCLEGRIVDFWPGTGRWIERPEQVSTSRPRDGRGIFNLLRHLGIDAKETRHD